MANTIIPKRSSVAGKVPLASDLSVGELAINLADGLIFTKNGAGSVISIGGGGGTSVTVSDTAPSLPSSGNLWWDTVAGALKIYYNDGTSSQWVDAFPYGTASSSSSSSALTGPFTNTYVLTGTTNDGAETEIFVNGVANSRIPVTTNKTVSFLVEITGRRTDGTTMESVIISHRCAALNNAGTTSDLGNLAETIIFRSDINFNADSRSSNTTDSLNIYVQGAAGKTLTWKAVVQTVEV